MIYKADEFDATRVDNRSKDTEVAQHNQDQGDKQDNRASTGEDSHREV
jgi:hypothetical protein